MSEYVLAPARPHDVRPGQSYEDQDRPHLLEQLVATELIFFLHLLVRSMNKYSACAESREGVIRDRIERGER